MPPDSSIEQQAQGELVCLHLRGPFDVDSASRLARRLADLEPTGLVLDFSGTCSFRDAGVAIAAEALRPHRVALRGLPRHPLRVFQAFGIGRDALASTG
ncbi:MAG TPA: STAS domain-containing protein [Myxococcaceae bacterium]|nr:STAS domain-containing protein [Myxococcaceae bacterium]